MKIKSIILSRLRNAAHMQFHNEVKILIGEFTPEALKIEPLFGKLTSLFTREDTAYKNIAKSLITEEMRDADRARDEVWKGLRDIIKGASRHFDPAVQRSAKQLGIIFKTYGDIAIKSFNEETSDIINLIQDLEGKYAPDVAAVGVGPWVVHLKSLNVTFANLYRDRIDESSEKVDIVLKKARAQLDEVYYEIAERINALVIVEGEAAYKQFIKKLNLIIDKYNLLITQAPKKPKKGSGEAAN